MADLVGDPATTVRYSVVIDGQDFGCFSECGGLSVEVGVEQYEEGGNSFYVHQLPGRFKYSNVKLTRPINKDSARVASWIAELAQAPRRTTASITALTVDGKPLVQWNLIDAFPVRWQGPQFKTDGPATVATESLELAHHGFLGG